MALLLLQSNSADADCPKQLKAILEDTLPFECTDGSGNSNENVLTFGAQARVSEFGRNLNSDLQATYSNQLSEDVFIQSSIGIAGASFLGAGLRDSSLTGSFESQLNWKFSTDTNVSLSGAIGDVGPDIEEASFDSQIQFLRSVQFENSYIGLAANARMFGVFGDIKESATAQFGMNATISQMFQDGISLNFLYNGTLSHNLMGEQDILNHSFSASLFRSSGNSPVSVGVSVSRNISYAFGESAFGEPIVNDSIGASLNWQFPESTQEISLSTTLSKTRTTSIGNNPVSLAFGISVSREF